MAILFHYQEPKYRVKNSGSVKYWLENVVISESRSIQRIDIYILNDDSIRGINREFLEHDYFTDVITFDYSDANDIRGEIYISYDTVVEIATRYKNAAYNELLRVILHGVLHLLGYDDKSDSEQELMRKMEDRYLEEFRV